jgi:hypothetical protein
VKSLKISDNQYLYRLETQNENGAVVEYQEIETIEPLRSVRDVHDEIDLENNKQIKRIEEIVFTGDSDEYWYNDDTHTTNTHFVAYMESLDLYCNPDNPYCETDKAVFEFGDVHVDENKNFFCTSVESNGINRIYISIDKSLLSYTVYSHETLKEYFKENPITVWYVLRYPVEIPRLHAKGHVMTHEGSTTIEVQPQTMGKVTPIVKATVEDSVIEMDSVPTLTVNNTDEGNQITDLVFEGVTIVNNAKADNVKGTKEISHTRYDFAPFYDGYTTINNTVEGGYVSAKLYGDTMINIAKPYGETELLTATEDGAIVDLLGENTDGVKLVDGTLTEGRIYGDSYVNLIEYDCMKNATMQNNNSTQTIVDRGDYYDITYTTVTDTANQSWWSPFNKLYCPLKNERIYTIFLGEYENMGVKNVHINVRGNNINYTLIKKSAGKQVFMVEGGDVTNIAIYQFIEIDEDKKGTQITLKVPKYCMIIEGDHIDNPHLSAYECFDSIGSTTNPTITFTTHPFIFGKGGRL